MVKYKFSNDGTVLTIIDSWKVKKADFQKTLNQIYALHGNQPVFNRTDSSMKLEWSVHNALYDVGLFRSHTQDVDFEYPQKWYAAMAYAIVGALVWPFIP